MMLWTTSALGNRLSGRVDRGLVDADVDQVASVLAVEDRVTWVETDAHRVTAKHQIRDAVKRPAPNAVNVLAAGQSLDTSEHLPCGAIGKCREQNPLRRYALLDQVSDAIGDRPRFARARTGDYQRGLRLRRYDANCSSLSSAL